MYANLNLLTKEECATLIAAAKLDDTLSLNEDYEFCAGKKHREPGNGLKYKRRPKSPDLMAAAVELQKERQSYVNHQKKVQNFTLAQAPLTDH